MIASEVPRLVLVQKINYYFCFFHICTVHLDIIKVLPTDAQKNALKGVLKFTLKCSTIKHFIIQLMHNI